MPGMDHHSGSKHLSYKDALQWQMPASGPGNSAAAQNDPVNKLKASLRNIMHRHPEGMSLAQIRRSCPLLRDPVLLKDFASSKLLLASLTDVVQLQGIGIQTRVCPAAAAAAPRT
ncbi:hypothetical protein ANANG_G00077500 [Anguilla anguilla]|uniref:Uncharacterized protein n=1 Tax=Anguilla anguilla TaxID=7936 RepID=A0A9D3S2H8_ANGAN|nr:hypothetical protein ANANG_G00077500 [Anguilla anguilla]